MEHHCRVCGIFNEDCPWGQDGKTPLYEICSCCGVEFGNEDYSIESVHEYRMSWLKNGSKWFNENEKPYNWALEKQLENIPEEFK